MLEKLSTLSADTVTAIAAVVVALVALGVSLWQGFITRKHNQLSVRPHLDFHIVILHREEATRITLKNTGVGPAIVKNFSVEVDNHAVPERGFIAISAALRQLDVKDVEVAKFVPFDDESIPAGDEYALIKFPNVKSDEENTRLGRALLRLQFRVEYESIYGERFAAVGPQLYRLFL